ncbi:hypothetical protein KIN20_004802 [Parelaphostrongylus tenuis]|uniref:Uncharacterized protein n=1 Tax=Parelaphostrongylus tenuis TaxID=148309 RepID=A0AAD5LZ32_PARTN|nr:hypothetical protein KIN20_004802 [Parelaphostrongylus tenuis]
MGVILTCVTISQRDHRTNDDCSRERWKSVVDIKLGVMFITVLAEEFRLGRYALGAGGQSRETTDLPQGIPTESEFLGEYRNKHDA